MRFTERQVGQVRVVDVEGRIVLGNGSVELREGVRQLAQDRHRQILLNLGGVSYMDSSAIGELLQSVNQAAQQGSVVKLLTPSVRIRELFRITRFDTVFDTHLLESEALASFGVSRDLSSAD